MVKLSDEDQIKEAGFSNVTAIDGSMDWHSVRITRIPGQQDMEPGLRRWGNARVLIDLCSKRGQFVMYIPLLMVE